MKFLKACTLITSSILGNLKCKCCAQEVLTAPLNTTVYTQGGFHNKQTNKHTPTRFVSSINSANFYRFTLFAKPGKGSSVRFSYQLSVQASYKLPLPDVLEVDPSNSLWSGFGCCASKWESAVWSRQRILQSLVFP